MFKSVLFAAGLTVAATTVSAGTVTVDYQEKSVFGSPNLSSYVKITSDKYTGGARAGMFRLRADGFDDFDAFCVDLAQYIANGKAYETAVNLFSADTMDTIDRLYTSAYALVDTAIEAAGFQIALWEIVEDTGSAYDLSTGAFAAQGAAVSQAQTFLDALGTETGKYTLSFLESGVSQDVVTGTLNPKSPLNGGGVVTVAPVPLPASGLLMLAGLAGAAGLRRRKG